MEMEEVRVAQYYVPNRQDTLPILFALYKLGWKAFSEVRRGNETLGFVFRFSLPAAVQSDLSKIFQEEINLEHFRHEPLAPITAFVPRTAVSTPCDPAPPENA